jgi:hypothetical protein
MRPASGYKEQAKIAARYSDTWVDFYKTTRHHVIFLTERDEKVCQEDAKSLHNDNDGSVGET